MKNRYLIFFTVVTVSILALIITMIPKGKEGKKETLPPIPILLKANSGEDAFDFWSVVKRGMNEAASEFSLSIEFHGPKEEKQVDRQIQIFRELLETDPPLIILAASNYLRMAPLVNEAKQRGIPLVTLDSAVNSSWPVSFIATDNVEAGHKAGYAMSNLLSPGDEIVIVAHIKGTATAIEREKGVLETIGEIVHRETIFCEGSQAIAYKRTLELLSTLPLPKGIIALNEPSALGVAAAIETKGLKDQIQVVGFDNAPQELEYLEQGILKAIVIQKPFNMGYLALRTAGEYLNGEKVKPFINTGSLLITVDNMYRQELQEILFPFGDY